MYGQDGLEISTAKWSPSTLRPAALAAMLAHRL
jgi:hypothetical protein